MNKVFSRKKILEEKFKSIVCVLIKSQALDQSKIKVAIVLLKSASTRKGIHSNSRGKLPTTAHRPPRLRLSLDRSAAQTARPWRPRPTPPASRPLSASRPAAPASGPGRGRQWPPLGALPDAAGFAGGACFLSCAAPPRLRPKPGGAGGWRTTTPP
jgi:hypothetical protein